MSRTYKDNKDRGRGSRRPNKKMLRELQRLENRTSKGFEQVDRAKFIDKLVITSGKLRIEE